MAQDEATYGFNKADASEVIQKLGLVEESTQRPFFDGRRYPSESAAFRLFLTPGGGIAARSGTTVSHASCTEYKLVAGVLTTNSVSKDIYNPWPVEIPASYYIVATQESVSNFWIAQFPGVIDVRWVDPDLEQTLDGTNYDNIDTAEDCP